MDIKKTSRSNRRTKAIRTAYSNASVIGGIGSVFNVLGSLHLELKTPGSYGKAIRGYWDAVGDDMYEAIRDFEKTIINK